MEIGVLQGWLESDEGIRLAASEVCGIATARRGRVVGGVLRGTAPGLPVVRRRTPLGFISFFNSLVNSHFLSLRLKE